MINEKISLLNIYNYVKRLTIFILINQKYYSSINIFFLLMQK